MKCTNAKEYLGLKIDGTLPAEKAGELEIHLDTCSECREFYEDLTLGLRMLAATEPQLPDNFDWKLQLKLNQALKDAVGETAYPWEEKSSGRLRWFQNFGAAAAVSMAAVLALAIFAGPSNMGNFNNSNDRVLNTRSAMTVNSPWQQGKQGLSTDRRSLQPMFQAGSGLYGGGTQYPVSSVDAQTPQTGSYSLNRALQGSNQNDIRTIKRLQAQVQYQNRILYQYQQEVKSLRAHLDTTGRLGVDLQDAPHQVQQ